MGKYLTDRRVWIATGIIVAILLIVLILSYDSGSTELQTVPVKRGDFSIDLVESGEIRAAHSVDIKAPMEWRMDLQIIDMAPEGSMAERGDVLVRFDVSTLAERLDAAKDKLEAERAEMQRLLAEQESRMSKLQADLSMAQYSKQIATVQLEQLKFEADVRREDARLALRKAEVEVERVTTDIESQKIIDEAARGRVELQITHAQGDVKELERKINELTLKAPISGMVVYNEIGSWDSRHKVAIGDKPRPGQAVVSIPNLDEIEAVLRVHEVDALKLRVGQPATVHLDAYPDREFEGVVNEVAQLAQKENFESKVKDFVVVVQIKGTDPILKPGMTVQAKINLAKYDSVSYVPTGAVYELNGQSVVFKKDSYPKPSSVSLGQRNDGYVVIEKGISDGDELVWKAPSSEYQRLGYDSVIMARRQLHQKLQNHFAAMDELGLTFDYDAYRNRSLLARADSNAGQVDVESMMAKIKEMRSKGGPIDLDPKMMKELRAMMRGQQGKFKVEADSGRGRRMLQFQISPKGRRNGRRLMMSPDSSPKGLSGQEQKRGMKHGAKIDTLRSSSDEIAGQKPGELKKARRMMRPGGGRRR